jgi:hypothetical protein
VGGGGGEWMEELEMSQRNKMSTVGRGQYSLEQKIDMEKGPEQVYVIDKAAEEDGLPQGTESLGRAKEREMIQPGEVVKGLVIGNCEELEIGQSTGPVPQGDKEVSMARGENKGLVADTITELLELEQGGGRGGRGHSS